MTALVDHQEGSFEHQKEKLARLMKMAGGLTDDLQAAGIELGEMANVVVVGNIAMILNEGGHDLATLERMARIISLLGRASTHHAQSKIMQGKSFADYERRIKKRLKAEVRGDTMLLKRLEKAVVEETKEMTDELVKEVGDLGAKKPL